MNNNSEDQDSLSDDIAEGNYEAAKPLKKAFLAWHRPRKQYVRENQWLFHINRLISSLKRESDEPLKYLGLPGVDLLDLRHIHNNLCEIKQIHLLFLGFNTCNPHTDAGSELNISLTEVRELPFVMRESDVIGADFRQIGEVTSKAHNYAKKKGPFDIVNLDLCDCFASESPENKEVTHYDAMKGLITLQGRRKEPWLLFLTTRGGSGDVHPNVLSKFAEKYKASLVECENFRLASFDHLGIGSTNDVDTALQTSAGEANVFLTSLCSWLLGEALSNMPPTTVELLGVLEYKVNDKSDSPDLFSIALKFSPSSYIPPDALGLSKPTGKKPSEHEYSTKFLPKIALRKNVDLFLDADSQVSQKMTEGMGTLLTQARYDGQEFLNWVSKGCPTNQ